MTVCARTKRASGIYRIHPFFLFYSVHPLYDHRASRVYIILYYFPWNWRTQRAHAHFKSRDNSPIILVFLFLYTKQVFVEYRLIFQLFFFFFQRNEYRFAPPFFFSKDICSLFLSKEWRDAANRNEANLRIARMSYVMHEDNKSLCRMIVRVILAKRWNTFKKGRSQTKLKWIRAWRRCSLNQSVSSFIL